MSIEGAELKLERRLSHRPFCFSFSLWIPVDVDKIHPSEIEEKELWTSTTKSKSQATKTQKQKCSIELTRPSPTLFTCHKQPVCQHYVTLANGSKGTDLKRKKMPKCHAQTARPLKSRRLSRRRDEAEKRTRRRVLVTSSYVACIESEDFRDKWDQNTKNKKNGMKGI